MKRSRIKLKKKTRKQLKRLARAAGGIAAALATQLVAHVTSTFLLERAGMADRAARPRHGDRSDDRARPAAREGSAPFTAPLPRTADQH